MPTLLTFCWGNFGETACNYNTEADWDRQAVAIGCNWVVRTQATAQSYQHHFLNISDDIWWYTIV